MITKLLSLLGFEDRPPRIVKDLPFITGPSFLSLLPENQHQIRYRVKLQQWHKWLKYWETVEHKSLSRDEVRQLLSP